MKQYRVAYSSRATQDLAEIRDYITQNLNSPQSASRIILRIIEKCESLNTFPNGHAIRFRSENKDVRFTHYGHYAVAFHVDDKSKTVTIYAIKYSRMNLENTTTTTEK